MNLNTIIFPNWMANNVGIRMQIISAPDKDKSVTLRSNINQTKPVLPF